VAEVKQEANESILYMHDGSGRCIWALLP